MLRITLVTILALGVVSYFVLPLPSAVSLVWIGVPALLLWRTRTRNVAAVRVLAAATVLPPASASAQTPSPDVRMSVTAQINGTISVQWTPVAGAATLVRYNNGSFTTIPVAPTNPTYTDPKPSGIVCYQYAYLPYLCIVPNTHSPQNPVVPITIGAIFVAPGSGGVGPNFGLGWGRPAAAFDSFWVMRTYNDPVYLPSSATGWPAYAWPAASSPPMCHVVAAVRGADVVGWSDVACALAAN